LKAPIFDATNSEPSGADDFKLVIIGAPAIGLRLTPEVSSLVKRLSNARVEGYFVWHLRCENGWGAENFGEGIG
jgi:hypothetical protein